MCFTNVTKFFNLWPLELLSFSTLSISKNRNKLSKRIKLTESIEEFHEIAILYVQSNHVICVIHFRIPIIIRLTLIFHENSIQFCILLLFFRKPYAFQPNVQLIITTKDTHSQYVLVFGCKSAFDLSSNIKRSSTCKRLHLW